MKKPNQIILDPNTPVGAAVITWASLNKGKALTVGDLQKFLEQMLKAGMK